MPDKREDILKLVECPRDAWQGLHSFIPTETKAAYIQALLEVGFDTIDMGSFVSPRAVPQVSDTGRLLEMIDTGRSASKLLVIVANAAGAESACRQQKVTYLGYPFSISETFQIRNANCTIPESLERVKAIRKLCISSGKELVIYISMAFGNPYGDAWRPDMAGAWIERLSDLGIRIFSLADTVGLASASDIASVFGHLKDSGSAGFQIGAHFHSAPNGWREKVAAAYDSGCRRFDGTVSGFGGCPFAQDALVGNLATENLAAFAREKDIACTIDEKALLKAGQIFTETIAPFTLQ
ncbi:MAG: hydroxymethylglutaryl-CoA lyase [Cytophagaceae bacterium SCN 52-12]|nr:MAG: hydroxymethylglutaryl-CoA lyase [Cytophagaceae bacterium SCN 52-12]